MTKFAISAKKPEFMKMFSGVQPTGSLHLGNYFGAIKNWVDLQNQSSNSTQETPKNQLQFLFGIMDLHAITVPHDPKVLQENILLTAATYIACGIDLSKSKIFIQSEVGEHCELAWLLGTIAPLGWLNRMTQFKEKTTAKDSANSNLGLYSYPVLMAADILLYQTDLVPVGNDQKQHLELTRDLAIAFNQRFKIDFFKLPQPLIFEQSQRIMSLLDGNKKMSKSDISEGSRINLTDSKEEILKKFKKAKTDSISTISYDESRSEIFNLLNIFALATNSKPEEIAKTYENSGFNKFKTDLAEAVITHLTPISSEIEKLRQDQLELRKILDEGRIFAKEIASQTKNEVFKICGLKA